MRRNNLSLLANGGAVTIDGSALPSGDACVWIHDADNLTLDGFEIRGGPENGISFGPSVGTRIRNCRIHDNERTGIFVWNAVNCTISDNEIYGNAFDPNASSSSLPHGVYIARGCAGIIFERNRVYNNTWLGVHCNGNSDQANTNIVIRENVIYGNGASAGDIMNTHDSWFYNNLAYNNNLDGASPAVLTLTSNAEGATGSFRNVVCNNTIVSNQKSRAIWLVGVPTEDVGSEDCVIFNNICVSTSGASAIDNDGVRNQLGSNLTLTWSTGVLSDLFEDYAAGDYRIRNNSAAENAGVETFAGKSAPAIDITGADRVSPYDLGAYEIAGGTPIPAYTLTVLPTTGGSIAKSPNKGTYSEGEEVTVTATAGVGYRFSGWTGDLSGTTNPETLAMTSNKTIGATFALGDDNPPLVPTLTDVSEINAGCATASWTANTEPDLGGYRIYYGTLSVEQGSASQYSDSVNVVSGATKEICGLTPATYYFAVGAYDILGHASAYSVERRLDVRGPDLTAPQILVGSPEDGAVAVDPRNTTIFFVVSDGHSGVDTNAVDVLVGGIRPATMSFSGDPSSYAVLCEMAGPLPSNSTVIVQVTAADRAHPSNVASVSWSFATQSTRPAIPTGLVAQGGNDGCASLSWDPNPEPDVSGYVIYYGTSSVALGQASQYDDSMTVGSVTTRNICGLMDGVYYLALRARNTSGLCGGLSAEVSATVTDIDLQGPIPPQQVQAQETTPGCVRVTWSANPEPNIGGYVIYYGPESIAQGEQTVYTDSVNVGISTTREICGFARGVVFFAVRAYNTAGLYSDYSAEKPVNVVGPDIDGPSVLIASPADGASGVSQDAEVMFVLSDGQSGVDTNSVEVRVQGAAPARVTFAGDPSQYAVVCRPNGELPANTIVTVAVQVSDLAVPPNGASRSWSFRTASSRPSAPAGLSATGGNSGCAQLEWDPNPESDLAGYVVCFGTASVQGGQASAYTDSVSLGLVTNQALCGLLDGTYYFAMRAKNVWGLLSGLSPEASAVVTTIDTQGPLPPQQVQLAENTPGCVTVTWQPNTEPDVAGYVVLRRPFSSLTGGPSQYTDSVDVGNVTSRELCSLSQGMYYFAVRAYDTSGIRGGLSTEKWIDVVGEDVMGPKVLVGGPTNGAIEVRPTSHVFFVLSDNQTGVDSSSLYVTVNGVPPAITSFSGDPSAFAVVCAPGSELPRNTRVTVQITIADLATPPNVTRVTWNFTTTSGRPTAPTGLTAQGDDVGCLMLAWNANPETDVTGYRIYYGRSSVALGDASSYDDSLTVGLITGRTICGLVEGTYYVSLRARNEDGLLSASSIEVSSDVSNGSAQPPLPPQNVQAIETYPGCVRVSWHRSSEPDVAGYVVYHGARSVQDGAASEYDDAVNVGNKSFTQICGFTVGSYFVAVRAYDNTGAFSGFSSEKQVTVLGEDVVPPNIIVAGPRDGATGVPVNTNILFVVADGQTGVNRASIDVRINGAEPSMLSISGDSTSFAVVCEPQGGLPQNSTVTVEVNATDLAETPNASGETWSFSTGAETDGTPPVLVAQDPAPGAKNVDPASTIRLRLRDASGISVPSIEFEVNGEVVTDTTLTFHDDGDVTIQFDNETGFTPGTTVNVSFSVSDLASNVFTDDFAFEVEGDAGSAGQTIARIVPDGYWIHDVSKPLEVRNLPLGWTVKIFDTSGYEVRSFRNSQSEGMDWVWDFENDHGRRVAKSLYLIRVIDQGGSVRSSGRFVVQSDG
jgi:parallel beta-helix repeat protein